MNLLPIQWIADYISTLTHAAHFPFITERINSYLIFFLGGILTLGCCFLLLYLFKRRNKSLFILSMLSFSLACILVGYINFGRIFSDTSVVAFFLEKAIIFSLFSSTPLMLFFIKFFFNQYISKKVLSLHIIISNVFILALFLLPKEITLFFLVPLYTPIFWGTVGYICYIFGKELIAHRYSSRLIIEFSLFLSLIGCLINDFLWIQGGIHTLFLLPIGIFVFLFFYSISLIQGKPMQLPQPQYSMDPILKSENAMLREEIRQLRTDFDKSKQDQVATPVPEIDTIHILSQLTAIETENSKLQSENETLRAEYQKIQAQLTALETQLSTVQPENKTQDISTFVDLQVESVPQNDLEIEPIPTSPSGLAEKVILICDNDPWAMDMGLDRMSHVFVAESIQKAVEYIQNNAVDILLVNSTLYQKQLVHIRSILSFAPTVICIAVSATKQTQSTLKILQQSGFHGFLSKPFSIDQLADFLSGILLERSASKGQFKSRPTVFRHRRPPSLAVSQ